MRNHVEIVPRLCKIVSHSWTDRPLNWGYAAQNCDANSKRLCLNCWEFPARAEPPPTGPAAAPVTLHSLQIIITTHLCTNVSLPCHRTAGVVPELPGPPQEAREPQPHVQRPHDLAAAQPPAAAHPHPRGAAVHGLRWPRGLNALRAALLHRQWAPTFPLRVLLGPHRGSIQWFNVGFLLRPRHSLAVTSDKNVCRRLEKQENSPSVCSLQLKVVLVWIVVLEEKHSWTWVKRQEHTRTALQLHKELRKT